MKDSEDLEFMKRIGLALKIMESALDLKPGARKFIACPICGNRRIISKAPISGHVYSFCENENCINIIQ